MPPGHQSIKKQSQPSIPTVMTMPKASGDAASFDAWMWNYIQASLDEKQHTTAVTSTQSVRMDDDKREDLIELAWEFLQERKYHRAHEICQRVLTEIEHDLAQDFGQNLHTTTLYDDPDEERREHYLNVLKVYQNTLQCLKKYLI